MPTPPANPLRLVFILFCLAVLIPVALLSPSARAQNADAESNESSKNESSKTELDTGQIQQWIATLGSSQFAARERAADSLISAGIKVVPILEKANHATEDPEIKLRTEQLIQQLRSGSQEARIESFLAGEDVDFENWGIIRAIFGDTPKSRDLFVELLQSYPELVSALDGTSRELVVAMDTVTEKLNNNRTKLGFQVRVSDAVALLLPATDENVPVSVTYENLMMTMMRLNPVNKVGKDKTLGRPFNALIGAWMARSQLANRQDVLYFAMERDLPQAYGLALNTLGETTEPEVLAHAAQALAKHGKKTDTAFLLPFLDDDRSISDRRFVRGRAVETELRDAIVAAIAILNDVPLEDVGLDDSVRHDKFAFVYEEAGHPEGEEGARKKARQKIEEVIANRVNEPQRGS